MNYKLSKLSKLNVSTFKTLKERMNYKSSQVKKKEKALQLGLALSPLHLEKISLPRMEKCAHPLNSSYTLVWSRLKQLADPQKILLESLYETVYRFGHQHAYTTHKKLMAVTGLKERSLKRYLSVLIEYGLIKVTNFRGAPNVYQIPSILFMERFARPLSKILSSCRYFLSLRAFSIMLLTGPIMGGQNSGPQRKTLSKEGILYNLNIKRVGRSEKVSLPHARTRTREEPMTTDFQKRESMERIDNENIIDRSDIQKIAKTLSLSVAGAVRLYAFDRPTLAHAIKKFSQEALYKARNGNPITKPLNYLYRVAEDLAQHNNVALDLGTVFTKQAQAKLEGFPDFHTPSFSVSNYLELLERERHFATASSPQKGRTQSRTKAHQSPDYGNKTFKPIERPKPDLRYPHQVGKPWPTSQRKPLGLAAKQALALRLHEPSDRIPPFAIDKNPMDLMGENVVEAYENVERHYQQNPDSAVAAAGYNPYEHAARQNGHDVDHAYQLRKYAWQDLIPKEPDEKDILQSANTVQTENDLDTNRPKTTRTNLPIRTSGDPNSPFKSTFWKESSLQLPDRTGADSPDTHSEPTQQSTITLRPDKTGRLFSF